MDFESLYAILANTSNGLYYIQHKERIRYTWKKVSHLISSGSVVAEIGVGPMAVLAGQLKRAQVTAIDINDSQANLCDHFDIDLRVCNIESESLPLENDSVDVILLLEVIEHLCAYPNDVLDKIYEKLKPGGYLIVSTVSFLRISTRIRALFGKNPLITYFEKSEDGRNHIREFVPVEMVHYMKESGYTIENLYRFGIPAGSALVSTALHFAYLYPNFRNHFLVIGKKETF